VPRVLYQKHEKQSEKKGKAETPNEKKKSKNRKDRATSEKKGRDWGGEEEGKSLPPLKHKVKKNHTLKEENSQGKNQKKKKAKVANKKNRDLKNEKNTTPKPTPNHKGGRGL